MSATGRATTGYLRAHRMPAALLFVASLLCALLPVVALGGLNAYMGAVREGAAGRFGGYAYQVSGGSGEVAAVMAGHVADGTAVAALSARGSLGVNAGGQTRRTVGEVSFLTGPSRYGTLVEGRQPEREGEIALSPAAAGQIGAVPGDTVTVGCDDAAGLPGVYSLVGLAVDPADAGAVWAAAVTAPDALAGSGLWLTDDPSIPESGVVAAEAGTGSVAVGRLESSVRRAEESARSRDLPGYRWYGLVLFAVAVCVLTATAVAFHRAGPCDGRMVVDALMACGFPGREARWTVFRGLLACTLPGTVVGIAAGYAVLAAAHGTIGAWFGQYWRWTLSPESLAGIAFVAATLACSTAISWPVLFHRPPRAGMAPAPGRAWPWHAVPAAIMLALACVAIERYHAAEWAFGGVMGTLLGGAATGALLASLPWLARTPATSRATGRQRTLAAPACALALLLLAAGSWFSGQMMLATGGPDNGLFIANYLSQRDVDYLAREYPDAMAGATVLVTPDESEHLVRATSAEYYECVVRQGFDDFACGSGNGLINETIVALVDPDSPLAGRARDDQTDEDGTTGVILIDPSDQSIVGSARVSIEGADPLLDAQTMPGLVLGIGSPQALELGITPGSQRTLVITDFPSIASGTRDAIRSEIINRCGYAFITEHDTTSLRSYQARAIAMPTLTAIGAALIFAALAASTRHSQSRLRRTLGEFGADRPQLMRLFAPLGVTMGVGSALALLFGWLGAHPWIIAPSPEFGDTGWWWLIPLPLILAETAVLAWWNSRPEPEQDDTGR